MKTKTTMRRSWLVQRLQKPHGSTTQLGALIESSAFGGGLQNGGLTSEAMSLLRGIFSFDYMGAAEFEFGAIPEALRSLAGRKAELVAGSFEIPLTSVAANWREDRNAPEPEGDATIYYLCRKGDAEEVQSRARSWASGSESLKEPTRLAPTLRPVSERDREVVGWLELDNGFFVFTDQPMWAQTCALFGASMNGGI